MQRFGARTAFVIVGMPFASSPFRDESPVYHTANTSPPSLRWIPKVDNLTENIQLAIDNGAIGAFMQGSIGDRFAKDGCVDLIEKVIAFIKKNGLAAGVGSHSIEAPQAVEKEGLEPDFYFKTFNGVDYCSQEPRQIAEFMKSVHKPWIAFKVLGAGVVRPREGFRLALGAGADFLNVGMFDFQVKENAAIMTHLLAGDLGRQRPWRS